MPSGEEFHKALGNATYLGCMRYNFHSVGKPLRICLSRSREAELNPVHCPTCPYLSYPRCTRTKRISGLKQCRFPGISLFHTSSMRSCPFCL